MRRGGRLAHAKGHALRLLEHAARTGDDAALLCFGGGRVQLVLPPARTQAQARSARHARVHALGGGGGTPLAQALAQADHLMRHAAQRQAAAECWLWLLTDGRTLEQPLPPRAARHIVIVDFDDPARPLGRCAAWAARWGAEHRPGTPPP
jgi:magnesium chelatase subunit ChlD-like protein